MAPSYNSIKITLTYSTQVLHIICIKNLILITGTKFATRYSSGPQIARGHTQFLCNYRFSNLEVQFIDNGVTGQARHVLHLLTFTFTLHLLTHYI